MKKDIPPGVAAAVICACLAVAGLAIYWGINRTSAAEAARIEKVIQAGVVGGGAKMPDAAQQGVIPKPAGPGAPTLPMPPSGAQATPR